MAKADVILEVESVITTGKVFVAKCWDICLDHPDRRSEENEDRPRRALVHGHNDELVINYNGDYPEGVTIVGDVRLTNKIVSPAVHLEATDLRLDHPDRRSEENEARPRRALVHGHNDELVINYERDYPGGTVIHGDLKLHFLGTITQIDNQGRARLQLSSDALTFRDPSGDPRVNIHPNDYDRETWPSWPGESNPLFLSLVDEVRQIKERLLSEMRAPGGDLGEPAGTVEADREPASPDGTVWSRAAHYVRGLFRRTDR